MMIEVAAARAAGKHLLQPCGIGRKRDGANSYFIAGLRFHAFEQRDVALHAGDENTRSGLAQAQLMESADAVGIAVENIIEYSHVTGAEACRVSRASLHTGHRVCQLAPVQRLAHAAGAGAAFSYRAVAALYNSG